jgi:Domain of unknown function (DUF397)
MSSALLGADVHGEGWRKSSHSMANGNCVEATSTALLISIRDSAGPNNVVVGYSAQVWRAFIAAAKAGEFDTSL